MYAWDPPPGPAPLISLPAHRAAHPKITLNVGGARHEVMWRLLEKRPLTRLGRIARASTHEVRTGFISIFKVD